MKGKSFITENRELAFRVFCACGGNVEMTLRELKKQGLELSRPTMDEWIEKFNFIDRRLKVDMERQKSTDNQISFEERMMSDLLKQKEKYEKYFESITGIDNQAQFAYSSLLKTIMDIKSKLGSDKAGLFIDFMKELISYLSREDPVAVPVIEKNFDEFISYARIKYAA